MSYTPTFRDKAVVKTCNFIITHFASREYRAFVTGVNQAGVANLLPWLEEQEKN